MFTQLKEKFNIPLQSDLSYIKLLLCVTFFSISLYFIRLNLFSISISILTINLFILCTILLYSNFQSIPQTFKKNSIFWTFSFLFVLSFLPSLLLHPTIHGLGVFLEWLLLPLLTAFLLHIHISKHKKIFYYIQNLLVSILFFVTTITLIYLFLDNTTFDGRLAAFYPSPNHLAMFIAPLIFITLANSWKQKNKYLKVFSITTVILTCIVLFFTNSLTSSFVFIFILFIISIILIKNYYIRSGRTCPSTTKSLMLFILGLFFILSILFITYHKISNINPDFSRSSLSSRHEIWTVATNHLQKNTLINTSGINDFQQIYLDAQRYYPPYLHWSAPTPHNLLLTLWTSGGFFTVLFFCLLCSRWLYLSASSYIKTKNATILFYIAAFLTILLTSLFDTPFWKNDLSIIFWILLLFGLQK
jgi:O-antigen ligase